jgi:hypothetical protein
LMVTDMRRFGRRIDVESRAQLVEPILTPLTRSSPESAVRSGRRLFRLARTLAADLAQS